MNFFGKNEQVENKKQEENVQLLDNGARLESASKELLKLTTALSNFDVNMHFISTRSKYASQ